jgi:hypothetical protein
MSASSRFQWKQLLILVLLSLWLASCQWISPVNTQPTHTQNVAGKGDFSLLAANPQTGQMITMPSQVIKQPLQALEQPPSGKHFRLHLSSKASNKGSNQDQNKTILMPEQGSFELVVQSGPKFKVLDANASDGQAIVQLPASHYLALLKLHGQHTRTQKRSLQLEDNLYYLSHELQRAAQGKGSFQILAQNKAKKLELTPLCSSDPEQYRLWKVHNPNSEEIAYDWQLEGSEQSGQEVAPPGDSVLETESENDTNKLLLSADNKRQDSAANKGHYCDPEEAERSLWWQLGNRALPVPSSWKSSDGEKYVLRLKNEGVTDLTFRWYKTPNQTVALPPGTAEIGPAGGTVELPGVAKLEIPAGALATNTVVKVSQQLQAASRKWMCVNPNDPSDCHNGYVFATPIVKLEPLGLVLQQHAKLYTQLFPKFSNRPFPDQSATLTPDDYLSWHFGYLGVREEITSLDQLKPNDFILVKQFAYIAKEVSYIGIDEPDVPSPSFRIKANEPSGRVLANRDFLVSHETGEIKPGALENAAAYLQIAYDYYTSDFAGLKHPLKWKPKEVPLSLRKIPVELHKQLYEQGQPSNGSTSRPVFCDAPNQKNECIKKGSLIELTSCRPSCDFHSQDAADTSIHELFHAFQMAYATKTSELPGADDNWFIEGTAALVRARISHLPHISAILGCRYSFSLKIEGDFYVCIFSLPMEAIINTGAAQPLARFVPVCTHGLSIKTANTTSKYSACFLNQI